MNSKICIVLCICISQVLGYPIPDADNIPVESDYDLLARNIIKKDIFTSRGWGASGMPYTAYYAEPNQNKPQQRHKNRQTPAANSLYAKQKEDLEKTDDLNDIQSNNYQALRSPAFEENAIIRSGQLRKLNNPPKNKYTIPQLFISYGWGPMG